MSLTRVSYGVNARESARQARICREVPGLAGVFAEVARALTNYAADNRIALDDLRPETFVSPVGKIVVAINPPES